MERKRQPLVRSRKGTYWFDQTNCSPSDGDRAWAFSVEARTAQDSSEFFEPKDLLQAQSLGDTTRSDHPSQRHPRGMHSEIPRLSLMTKLMMKVDMVKPLMRRKPHMPQSTFISKSQAKKKAKADSMLVDQSIKENEAMMLVSEMLAKSENAVMNAPCLTAAPCREESVNMVQGWRRDEEGWVRVRSVMNSGCGVCVWRHQECVPLVPLRNPKGRVVVKNSCLPAKIPCRTWESRFWGGETMIKYQIADVSSARISSWRITSIAWTIG